jgi:hypothetical protein
MHADKHGFMAIPPEDEAALLDASIFSPLKRRRMCKAKREKKTL